jgi:hypothetical protein
MPPFELTTRVGAPPEATFDLLRPVRFPEWRSAIEEVAPVDGPLDRPGAQFVTHYRSRLMPGSRHEITAIDPPRLLGLRGEAEGARYRATFRLDDAGAATELRFELEYEAGRAVGAPSAQADSSGLGAGVEDLERLKASGARRTQGRRPMGGVAPALRPHASSA